MLPAPGSGHGQGPAVDPGQGDVPGPLKPDGVEGGHADRDEHRALGVEVPGRRPDHEPARADLRRHPPEQVAVGVDDDGLLSADLDDDVVAAGQVETGEGGKRARLRRGDARAGARRAARVVEEDPVDKQRHEDRGQQERAEGHEAHDADLPPLWADGVSYARCCSWSASSRHGSQRPAPRTSERGRNERFETTDLAAAPAGARAGPRAVAASAGKKDSIASSATVMSTAVPNVATVLKKRSSRPSPARKTSGTKTSPPAPWSGVGVGRAGIAATSSRAAASAASPVTRAGGAGARAGGRATRRG